MKKYMPLNKITICFLMNRGSFIDTNSFSVNHPLISWRW